MWPGLSVAGRSRRPARSHGVGFVQGPAARRTLASWGCRALTGPGVTLVFLPGVCVKGRHADRTSRGSCPGRGVPRAAAASALRGPVCQVLHPRQCLLWCLGDENFAAVQFFSFCFVC